jgi:hypothetical protein
MHSACCTVRKGEPRLPDAVCAPTAHRTLTSTVARRVSEEVTLENLTQHGVTAMPCSRSGIAAVAAVGIVAIRLLLKTVVTGAVSPFCI